MLADVGGDKSLVIVGCLYDSRQQSHVTRTQSPVIADHHMIKWSYDNRRSQNICDCYRFKWWWSLMVLGGRRFVVVVGGLKLVLTHVWLALKVEFTFSEPYVEPPNISAASHYLYQWSTSNFCHVTIVVMCQSSHSLIKVAWRCWNVWCFNIIWLREVKFNVCNTGDVMHDLQIRVTKK